jgi:hypothetical protein
MSNLLRSALLAATLATTQVQADEPRATETNVPKDGGVNAVINTATSRFTPPILALGETVCTETGILFKETFCSSSQIVVLKEPVGAGDGSNASLTFREFPVLQTRLCRFGAMSGECQTSTVPLDLTPLAPRNP